MSQRFFYYSLNLLLVLVFLLAANVNQVQAQSGRRVPPPPPAPVENSRPETTKPRETFDPPPAAKNEEKEVVERKPFVLTYDQNAFELPQGNTGNNITGLVVNTCLERLRQYDSISVTPDKEMNRGQASNKAKADEHNHFIWLQVRVETFNSNGQPQSLQDFAVDYVVFSPKDGKIKANGRVYLRPYQPGVGIGGVNLPLPANIPLGVPGVGNSLQYSLLQAGVETADRIMQGLKIAPPTQPNRRF